MEEHDSEGDWRKGRRFRRRGPFPSLSSGGFRHRREILNCEGKAEENRNKQLKPHKTAEPTEIWASASAELRRDSDSMEISKVLLQLLSPRGSSNHSRLAF